MTLPVTASTGQMRPLMENTWWKLDLSVGLTLTGMAWQGLAWTGKDWLGLAWTGMDLQGLARKGMDWQAIMTSRAVMSL